MNIVERINKLAGAVHNAKLKPRALQGPGTLP